VKQTSPFPKSESKPRGRPTSLTPSVARAIVESLRAGVYVQTAATIAGVSKQSFYEWCKRGKAGEQPYADFLDACEKAIAHSESNAVKSIRAAGKKNWQALCWWLERRHRQRWARNVDLGAQMPFPQPQAGGGPVVVTGPKELTAADDAKNA
jgi:hypothetical protein